MYRDPHPVHITQKKLTSMAMSTGHKPKSHCQQEEQNRPSSDNARLVKEASSTQLCGEQPVKPRESGHYRFTFRSKTLTIKDYNKKAILY